MTTRPTFADLVQSRRMQRRASDKDMVAITIAGNALATAAANLLDCATTLDDIGPSAVDVFNDRLRALARCMANYVEVS